MRLRLRPKTKKKIVAEVKKDININTYNKYLFIFETVLLVGVIEEFIEGYVLGLDLQLFLHMFLVMVLVGTSFTGAIAFVEPLLKGSITWIVRFGKNKIVRVGVHAAILFGLFFLYGLVYFGTKVTPAVSIGLTAQ